MAIDNDLDFAGKTILVTGSGRNIGRVIILEFARRGANVIINARTNVEAAQAVENEARALGAKTLVVMGAAGELTTVEEMKRRATDRFGHVDIYVSNAARRLHKSFFETTNEDWHFFLNQQLTASWYLAKAFVPGMIAARWGRIVHINGADGYTGGWMRVPHATAKGALRSFTKSLAAGLAEHGITVNDVVPGFMDTVRDEQTHPGLSPDQSAQLASRRIPIRRQPRMDELSFAVAFLCSPRAGAITGSAIHVDGGARMLG
jgi:NAD(P)-dependent dehydrogenase (short-subunit alcohol dehydrogenase family)